MPTILLVEDGAIMREMLTMLLHLGDYTIVTASAPSEGLAHLKRHSINLVLSDSDMPPRDGVAFYEHVRANPLYHTLPIILISAVAPPQAVTTDPHATVLPKPVEPGILLTTITRMINQKQLGITY